MQTLSSLNFVEQSMEYRLAMHQVHLQEQEAFSYAMRTLLLMSILKGCYSRSSCTAPRE
jgi:hypothetical protein